MIVNDINSFLFILFSCWVSARDQESIWTYVAPVLAIVAGTLIIILIAFSASCEKVNIRAKKAKLSRIRYRLLASFVFLFIMAGAVFAALLAVAFDVTLFTYIFAGACALEGLYMFLFYVVFNRKVRRLVT